VVATITTAFAHAAQGARPQRPRHALAAGADPAHRVHRDIGMVRAREFADPMDRWSRIRANQAVAFARLSRACIFALAQQGRTRQKHALYIAAVQ